MSNNAPKKTELKHFKQPTTLDEALSAKLDPIVEAINEHVEKIYKDFNIALFKQIERIDGLAGTVEQGEISMSRMVQVLWGIVNKSNARNAALERVLLRNGLDQKQLEEEIITVERELLDTGDWSEASLETVGKKLFS